MEQFVTALVSQRHLRENGDYFYCDGSAILAKHSESRYYLIATRHQAARLKVATKTWVYLPSVAKAEPVTIIAESETADVAILQFETSEPLETLMLQPSDWDWKVQATTNVVMYGFPMQNRNANESKLITDVFDRLRLRTTAAQVKGVAYNQADGLRLIVDQLILDGESGGLTFSPDIGPLGVNQGRNMMGEEAYITPFWEAIALLDSLQLP